MIPLTQRPHRGLDVDLLNSSPVIVLSVVFDTRAIHQANTPKNLSLGSVALQSFQE
jgi:hypothetical protein